MRISSTVLFFACLLIAIAYASAELAMEHKELDSVDKALMDVVNKLQEQVRAQERRVDDALLARDQAKNNRLAGLEKVHKEHKDRIAAETNYNVQRAEEEAAERELKVLEARHRDAQALYEKTHADALTAIAALDRELKVIHEIRRLLGLPNREAPLTTHIAHKGITKADAHQIDTFIGSESTFLHADQRFSPSVRSETAIQIYDTCNYQGQSVRLHTSTTDVGAENTQRVKAIRVPAGFAVTVFTEKDYKGQSETYFADTPCTASNFAKIGSIKVTEHVPVPVTFWEHCKWDQNGGRSVQSLGDVPKIPNGLNNQYSAVDVPAGWKVIAYAEENFQGHSIELKGSMPCFVDQGWNDIISSFKVVKA